tara:strand:- start:237 stop:764 length:528 start_codon:yes stop_codon:yes gene_type:complete
MVEPVTILAGVALAKKCFDALSTVSETAEDVSEVAHFVSAIFKTKQEIDAKVIAEEADNTDIEVAMKTVIEAKQLELMLNRTRKIVNKKFGQNTWNEILDVQAAAVEHKATQKKEHHHQDVVKKVKARTVLTNDDQVWDNLYKILVETGKALLVLSLTGAVFYAIWINRCTSEAC